MTARNTRRSPLTEPRRFDVEANVLVTVEVRNPDVIERVTGPGGDEWRSRFYRMHTTEDVLQHFAFNAVANGVTDISRLDGWADCDPRDVEIVVESPADFMVMEQVA